MRESSARRRRGASLAGALLLVLTVGGCGGEEQAARPPAPTPMARLNTTAMQVPRIEFCELVPDKAVADALGGEPDDTTSYGNGDEQQLPGVGTDVVHEIGCSWTTKEGAAARAWIFARPVETAFARTVVASSRTASGCHLVRGPEFGRPSLTQVCRRPAGNVRVRHAGLFGQTWLTCEVSADDKATAVRSRADDWCVQIANALDTAA